MNKWTWSVLGVFVIWVFISTYWYVCLIKGFCQEPEVVMQKDTISIGEIDNEVANRPLDNVKNVASVAVTEKRETDTKTNVIASVTREKVVQCDAYLDSYLRKGYQNSSSDMRKLEEFLNQYENENLAVNGVFESSDENAVERFQEKYHQHTDQLLYL